MSVSDFLKNLVSTKTEYNLTKEDQNMIRSEGVEKFILSKLNSSKYRAQKTSEDYQEKIVDKITLCVAHRLPIHLSLPFGATKNPYLPTAPGIDWAEVFNFAYVIEYLAPIAKVYKYGVKVDYISVAIFEEKVNRIPQKDTDVYDKEFIKMIGFYQKLLPKNFSLSYSRVSDSYSKKETDRLLEIKINQLRKTWRNQKREVIDYKLLKARRNCLYSQKDKNRESYIFESALGHDAFCSEFWTTDVAPWDKKDMITLGHNYTNGWAIHIRSTRGSSVNFWSGLGLLEIRKNGEYIPTVYSLSQYQSSKEQIKMEKSRLFATGFSNLKEIPTIEL